MTRGEVSGLIFGNPGPRGYAEILAHMCFGKEFWEKSRKIRIFLGGLHPPVGVLGLSQAHLGTRKVVWKASMGFRGASGAI